MSLPTQDVTLGVTSLFLNPIVGEEWDIVFDELGQIVMISGDEYIGQKVKQLLGTASGEVVTDINYGTPYYQEILGMKNPNLNAISNTFSETILDNEILVEMGVVECSIGTLNLNDNRELLVDDMTISTSNYLTRIQNFGV